MGKITRKKVNNKTYLYNDNKLVRVIDSSAKVGEKDNVVKAETKPIKTAEQQRAEARLNSTTKLNSVVPNEMGGANNTRKSQTTAQQQEVHGVNLTDADVELYQKYLRTQERKKQSPFQAIIEGSTPYETVTNGQALKKKNWVEKEDLKYSVQQYEMGMQKRQDEKINNVLNTEAINDYFKDQNFSKAQIEESWKQLEKEGVKRVNRTDLTQSELDYLQQAEQLQKESTSAYWTDRVAQLTRQIRDNEDAEAKLTTYYNNLDREYEAKTGIANAHQAERDKAIGSIWGDKDWRGELKEAQDNEWYLSNHEQFNKVSENADFKEKIGYVKPNASYDSADSTTKAYIWLNNQKLQNNTGMHLENMTQDEIERFNYIYNTQGIAQAKTYLDVMSYTLNEREQTKRDVETAQSAKDNPVGTSIASVGTNFVGGVAGIVDKAVQHFTNLGDGVHRPIDYNTDAQSISKYGTTVRQTVADSMNNETAAFVYNTLMSVADSAASIAATGGVAWAATIPLAMSAAEQTAQEAHAKGLNSDEAGNLAVVGGLAEYVCETVSLGSFTQLIKGGEKSAIANLIKQSTTEGLEEVSTDLINFGAEQALLGENSEINLAKKKYMEMGYSEEEARQMACVEVAKQFAVDFAAGALSGGVFGAGASVINNVNAKIEKTKTIRKYTADVSPVLDLFGFTESQKSAIIDGVVKEGLTLEESIKSKVQSNESQSNSNDLTTLPTLEKYGVRAQIRELTGHQTEGNFSYDHNDTNKTVTSQDTKNIQKIKRIADALGINVVAHDNIDFETTVEGQNVKVRSGSNGYFDKATGTIHVALDSENPVQVVLAHELTHRIKAQSQELYNGLLTAVKDVYGETKFNEFISDIMANENLDEDAAIEEVIANACDMFLDGKSLSQIQNLANSNRNLAVKIRDFIAEMIQRISDFITGANKSNYKESNLLKEQLDSFKEIKQMWDDALGETVSNEYSNNTETVSGDVEIINGSAVKSSLKTWTAQEINRVKSELADKGFSQDTIDNWVDDVNSVAAIISNDQERLDFEAADNQVFMKPNADYVVTLDASTLCAKRLLYQGTFNAIQHRMNNTMLSSDMLLDLLDMMRENGDETPCGVCYVESRRRHLGKFAQDFLNGYNGEYKPNIDELTTTDGLEQLRNEHPQAYNDFIKAMNKKGTVNPKVVQLRTEYRGDLSKLTASQIDKIIRIGGLRVQSFSDFETPHLLDMMQAVLDMSSKGLTSQAYTKVPNFAWVFGNTGIKINLSLIAKGNGLDANGNLVFDSKEGMDINEALRLRDAYSDNVGTILVGVNDAHILAAMADDRIDFIIPFHKSGWGANELALMGMQDYTDYTKSQNEADIKTKKSVPNLYPADYWDYNKTGKENAEEYLRICAEQGRIPKFSQFLVDNGDGSFSLQADGSTDGYWKTLIDFKMYNNEGIGTPQQAVQPNFNMSEAERVLAEYEGHANELPVSEKVVNQFVQKYSDNNIVYSKKRNTKPVRVAEGDEKVSSFRANLNNSASLTDTTKRVIKNDEELTTYRSITNDDTINAAAENKENLGYDKWRRRMQDKKKNIGPEEVTEGFMYIVESQNTKDYEQMNEAIRLIRERGSKAGQIVQSFKLLSLLTPEGMAAHAQHYLDKAWEKITNLKAGTTTPGPNRENVVNPNKSVKSETWCKQNVDLFKLNEDDVNQLKGVTEIMHETDQETLKAVCVQTINDIVNKKLPPSLGSILRSVQRISLLGNAKTQVRNFVSNAAMLPEKLTADIIATGFDKYLAKQTGNRTVGLPNAKSGIKGFVQGGREALTGMKNDFRDIFNSDTAVVKTVDDLKQKISNKLMGDKYEHGSGTAWNTDYIQEQLKSAQKSGDTARVKRLKGQLALFRAMRLMDTAITSVLSLGDRPFYQAHYLNSLNNQLKLNGFTAETVPAQRLSEMMQLANTEALEATFQDDNKFTEAVTGLRNALNKIKLTPDGQFGLGSLLLPFAKTPANLTRAAIKYSPAGFFTHVIKEAKTFKNNPSIENQHTLVSDLGKACAGTMFYIIGWILASAGIISGGLDDDKDTADWQKNQLGLQPYSFSLGGKTYTYDWAAPLGTQLAVGADVIKSMVDSKESGEDVELSNKLINILGTAADTIFNQSCLTGLQEFFGNIGDGFINALVALIEDLPAQFVPFGTTLKQIQNLNDDTKRRTYSTEGVGQNIANNMSAMFNSKGLEPQVDALGNNPLRYGGDNTFVNNFLNPANVSTGTTSEVAQEIQRIVDATQDTSIYPTKASVTSSVDNVKLTDEEYTAYQEALGKTVNDAVKQAMGTEEWNNLTDQQKGAYITKMKSYASLTAKNVVRTMRNQATEESQKWMSEDPVSYQLINSQFEDGMSKSDKMNILRNSSLTDKQVESVYTQMFEDSKTKEENSISYAVKNGISARDFIKTKLGADAKENEKQQTRTEIKESTGNKIPEASDYTIPESAKTDKLVDIRDHDLDAKDYYYINDRASAYSGKDRIEWIESFNLGDKATTYLVNKFCMGDTAHDKMTVASETYGIPEEVYVSTWIYGYKTVGSKSERNQQIYDYVQTLDLTDEQKEYLYKANSVYKGSSSGSGKSSKSSGRKSSSGTSSSKKLSTAKVSIKTTGGSTKLPTISNKKYNYKYNYGTSELQTQLDAVDKNIFMTAKQKAAEKKRIREKFKSSNI